MSLNKRNSIPEESTSEGFQRLQQEIQHTLKDFDKSHREPDIKEERYILTQSSRIKRKIDCPQLSLSTKERQRYNESNSSKRISHPPASKTPILPLDPSSHISMILRQDVLRQCFEQHSRIYESRNDCHEFATQLSLETEGTLFKQSNSSQVYRSTAVNIIHRLKKTLPTSTPPQNRLPIRAPLDYHKLLPYMITINELYQNDFPLDVTILGVEVIRYQRVSDDLMRPVVDAFQRRCDRCGSVYSEPQESDSEKCKYHPKRACIDLAFGSQMGEKTRIHGCCGKSFGSSGCVYGPHVFSIDRFMDLKEIYEFVSTYPYPGNFKADRPDNLKCLALDCEMVYTTDGIEVGRVTLIDACGDLLLDEFVKPQHPILDYCTAFSGLTKNHLEPINMTLTEIHQKLLTHIYQETILIGHSLDSDLKALRLIHKSVIDTSILFPHPKGIPYRYSLKHLTENFLHRLIQQGEQGHDSYEDALACLDLVNLKIK